MRFGLTGIAFPLALIGAFAPEARAQSDAADATIQVNILSGTVTVVNTAGIDFGTAFASDGVLYSSDVGTAAAWTVDVTGASSVQLSFALPTEMWDAGNSSVVAVNWGGEAGTINEGANPPLVFDPNLSYVYPVDPAGTQFTVELGADANNNGAGDVFIDVSSAVGTGLHTAVATMTVTIL